MPLAMCRMIPSHASHVVVGCDSLRHFAAVLACLIVNTGSGQVILDRFPCNLFLPIKARHRLSLHTL
jgi:hypothetical protein